MGNILLRRANENDLPAILCIFKQTIEVVNANDYSPEQIQAWTSGVTNLERWLQKITEQHFLLAYPNDIPSGFASITSSGYLDFLYVSASFQRQGIARALYAELERFAKGEGLLVIETDASITAKPFFEKKGFIVVLPQHAMVNGIALPNFKMRKQLI